MPSRLASRPYRCVTDDGTRCFDPSGTSENTNASRRGAMPSVRARSTERSQCSVSTPTVAGSSDTRRCWWVLVSFSVRSPAVLGDGAPVGEHTVRQVDVRPAQPAQLAAPRPRRHRQPHERTPFRVLPGGLDDPRGLLSRRRSRVGPPRCRGNGEHDRVRRHPPPAHTLSRRRRGARSGCGGSSSATRVADMRRQRSSHSCSRGVRWSSPALVRAVRPAPTQLGVQRVQRLGLDRASLQTSDERADVLLQVPRVHPVRRVADVKRRQVPVEQLVERGARPRVAALVDLSGQPRPGGLGLRGGLGASRDDLHERVPLPRQRVLTTVHAHPQRAAGQLVDRPALLLSGGPGPRHGGQSNGFRVTKCVTQSASCDLESINCLVKLVGAAGFEPATARV